MLTLSRKIGERILIGDSIVVEVSSIEGDQCWLSISAPDSMRIDREEVRRRIDERRRAGEAHQ